MKLQTLEKYMFQGHPFEKEPNGLQWVPFLLLISYFLLLISDLFSKVRYDAQDVETFRVGAFTYGAVADQRSTGNIG